jgi:glycosyltransferase involved in cell wall biosynthesis
MKHASVFLYPSWYEGFGLPLHEAARFGTPCIASTAGALPETAPEGTHFAPPGKPHLWKKALEMVLTAPERYRTKTALQGWEAAAKTIKNTLESNKFF